MNVHRLDRGGAIAGRLWLAGWLPGCDGWAGYGAAFERSCRWRGGFFMMSEHRQPAEHLLTVRDLIARGVAVSVLIVGALLVLLLTPGV